MNFKKCVIAITALFVIQGIEANIFDDIGGAIKSAGETVVGGVKSAGDEIVGGVKSAGGEIAGKVRDLVGKFVDTYDECNKAYDQCIGDRKSVV